MHERHLHLHVLHLIAVGALPRAWCGALGVEDSPDRHPSKVAKIFSHPIKKKNQRIATSEKKKKKFQNGPPPGVEGVVDGCYCGWDLRKALHLNQESSGKTATSHVPWSKAAILRGMVMAHP